jgi:FkbM family methyltransferase
VTDRHGTGVILSRIFGEAKNVLSIRTENLYQEHALGEARVRFGHKGLRRSESYARLLRVLNGSTVRRILCVPYHPDELVSAIVLHELFAAPLCLFLMDDNNIHRRGIPNALMREALGKARLRLAISPELRDAYERRYGFKFWVVPPVVRNDVVQTTPRLPVGPHFDTKTGVLVGSIWSAKWLQQLRQTVRSAGLKVHWYGNAKAPWLKVRPAELEADGIVDCGFLPEAELTVRVRDYPYALIPSGSLDEADDRPEIARLSLPTRMPFLLAASNTPMIALGSPRTAAAQFLARFEVGQTSPYEGARLRQVVEAICEPKTQLELRHRAAAHSALFSAKDLAGWIWTSLERGEPQDDRFEQAFRRTDGDIVAYIDPPAPPELLGDNLLVYQALRRLRTRGFTPSFVVDVGSSTGIWSDLTSRVFPKARFILVDPLHERYVRENKWFFRQHPEFECVPVALADKPGEAELGVSSDLYGSSLLQPADLREYEPLKVPVLTLDELARERKLTGRGLLKIDVQFAEHLVLAGARQLLPQVDVLIVELSLFRYSEDARLYEEMCDLIRGLGFRYYEDLGGWRSPVDGTPLQKDVLFVRDGLFTYQLKRRSTPRTKGEEDLEPEPEEEAVPTEAAQAQAAVK